MRRIVLAASVALVVLLALAGSAGAVNLPSHRDPDGRPPGDPVRDPAMQPRAHFLPLGVKLAGSAVVNGHVFDYGGVALPSAAVTWWVPVGESYEWGDATTDPTGFYTLSDLPAAEGTGELDVTSPSQPWTIGLYGASWPDPGTTSFNFQPGRIWTGVIRGGPWRGWSSVTAYVYGSAETVQVFGMTEISGTSDGVWDYMYAPPGTYQVGVVYFWMDEGAEFSTTATVTAGTRSAQAVAVAQEDAQRLYVTAPYWGSGKPGTTVNVRHWNYPAGWKLHFYGYSDSPSGSPFKDYGSFVATGADPFNKSLKIPTTAPAGYWYVLQTDHSDGPLTLDAPFQVCTLKSTRAAIRKGGRIKLSGVIPTEGHRGSTPGKSKYVTIYKRTKSVSAAPTAWDPTTKGWTKVGRVKANGLGKYVTGYLKPSRTTWYVVRYPGDKWYWGAYTSVLRVRVY